jgi:hypothetical protein
MKPQSFLLLTHVTATVPSGIGVGVGSVGAFKETDCNPAQKKQSHF